MRVRERVPTPENDNRLNVNANNPFSSIPTVTAGVALTTHQQLASAPTLFQSSNSNNSVPILGTLLLSPIKESDSVVSNTLSSSSVTTAPNKSLLPLNIKSTNAFGSLVIPSNNSDIDSNTTNSFVVLPANAQNEISITTVPLTITTTSNQTAGAIITELPVDKTDSSISMSGNKNTLMTSHLENFFGEHNSTPKSNSKQRVQRQQSMDSDNPGNNNADNTNTNSTLSKRPTGTGKKHNEVYV